MRLQCSSAFESSEDFQIRPRGQARHLRDGLRFRVPHMSFIDPSDRVVSKEAWLGIGKTRCDARRSAAACNRFFTIYKTSPEADNLSFSFLRLTITHITDDSAPSQG